MGQEIKDKGVEEIEDRARKKLLSRLGFIRMDLEAIENLEIRDETIKDLIKGVRSRIELLFEGLKKDNAHEESKVHLESSTTGVV